MLSADSLHVVDLGVQVSTESRESRVDRTHCPREDSSECSGDGCSSKEDGDSPVSLIASIVHTAYIIESALIDSSPNWIDSREDEDASTEETGLRYSQEEATDVESRLSRYECLARGGDSPTDDEEREPLGGIVLLEDDHGWNLEQDVSELWDGSSEYEVLGEERKDARSIEQVRCCRQMGLSPRYL